MFFDSRFEHKIADVLKVVLVRAEVAQLKLDEAVIERLGQHVIKVGSWIRFLHAHFMFSNVAAHDESCVAFIILQEVENSLFIGQRLHSLHDAWEVLRLLHCVIKYWINLKIKVAFKQLVQSLQALSIARVRHESYQNRLISVSQNESQHDAKLENHHLQDSVIPEGNSLSEKVRKVDKDEISDAVIVVHSAKIKKGPNDCRGNY